MIFGQDRDELRQMYVDAWEKSSMNTILSPLEADISKVIADHPEYQDRLTAENIDAEFTPKGGESNPFLHMGLHLAIREQVATNRPPGITAAFKALLTRTGDPHKAEHLALDCLAETLWEAQKQNTPPDETAYLERLLQI